MRKRFYGLEHGQGLVEYALIIVLLAILLIVGLTFLGGGITNTYTNIIQNL
jgi:pilus assembly protein Flp/PilA